VHVSRQPPTVEYGEMPAYLLRVWLPDMKMARIVRTEGTRGRKLVSEHHGGPLLQRISRECLHGEFYRFSGSRGR
jgi:hypothetical protein